MESELECMGVASGSGWNLWVWLLGVVVRSYRFPHTTYPYSSCIFFLQQHPYFLFINNKKMFFVHNLDLPGQLLLVKMEVIYRQCSCRLRLSFGHLMDAGIDLLVIFPCGKKKIFSN